jgi:hypothetical protein
MAVWHSVAVGILHCGGYYDVSLNSYTTLQ